MTPEDIACIGPAVLAILHTVPSRYQLRLHLPMSNRLNSDIQMCKDFEEENRLKKNTNGQSLSIFVLYYRISKDRDESLMPRTIEDYQKCE